MDNRRPSLDRSQETGAKKPRLAADVAGGIPHARQVLHRPGSAGSAMSISAGANRYWGNNEKASDKTEAYQPLPQSHHDLVYQYKMALAELTFNSKPIITNLTIIAGENLLEAKAIAATICLNILEVSSDQKLPSLYLVDSIVKNIGRDYIRYFAARLPEVFLKTYRQIDPSLHQSMHHLFGTWKGVFPPQTLQAIEKELRPTAPTNSVVPSNRPDSQTQRSQHVIHVNPKYLEKQRLNTKVKEMPSDGSFPLSNSTMDVERIEKAPEMGRRWVDRIHSQRDVLNGQHHDNKPLYEDYEISRLSSLRTDRASGKSTDTQRGKNSFVGNSKELNQTIAFQSNGLTSKHGVFNQIPSKSSNVGAPRSSARTSNWKNSDEEEFIWNPREPDRDVVKASVSSRSDIWGSRDQEKIGIDDVAETRSVLSPLQRYDREGSSDSTENKEAFILKTSSWGILNAQSDENLMDNEVSVPGITFQEHHATNVGTKSIKHPASQPPFSGISGKISDHKASRLDHVNMPKHKSDDSLSVFLEQGLNYSSKPLHSDSQAIDGPRKSTTSGLLAAVMESGVLSKLKPSDPKIEMKKNELPQRKPSSAAPISNLLSSLVAKGLISTLDTEISDQNPSIPKTPVTLPHKTSPICSASTTPAVSDTNTEDISSNSTFKTSNLLAVPEILIGIQFKPDVMRELHPNVIASLSEDLPHQCNRCRMHFRFEQQLSRHSYWHSLKDSKQEHPSRKWYVHPNNWSALPHANSKQAPEEEPMVIADDDQCVCILCGEFFEDFYKNHTWMFRGAVRFPVPKQEITNHEHYQPIVHSKCFLDSSSVKMECDVE